MWCQPGCESCWHLWLLGSVTVAYQVGAEARKCHGAFHKVFCDSAHWESVFLQGGVGLALLSWASVLLLQLSSAAFKGSQLTEKNRQTLEWYFWSRKSPPFPSLLFFQCREGAWTSSSVGQPYHLPLQFLACLRNWELCSSLISWASQCLHAENNHCDFCWLVWA